ncbi:MAG TPA: gephyrin-like molybdotransferase Glp [Gaiellales bacterium]|nr:gephyrin-like molybdotransferase Glp [Gaiellales bacterium]
MISVGEALDLIRAAAPQPRGSSQRLSRELAGRVLLADVTAAVSLPPFATSAMDGYAVRAAELGGEPVPVAYRIAAGDAPRVLERGTAAAIATGGPVPEGADAVVPIEDAREDGGLTAGRPRIGAAIRPSGGDLVAGDIVARRGAVLRPAVLAAIAAAGVDTIEVAARPRIGIVATGSELVRPGRPLAPGQIYESNTIAIAAQAVRAGAEVASTEIVEDDPEATRSAFECALADADVVVSSGGVSVGPHDYVKPALERLGVREVFWRVRHKPGKPLWFGAAGDGTLVFGLPGNPVSSVVCFELFVRAALEAMTGAEPGRRPVARLAEPVSRLAERDHAVRCTWERREDGMRLRPQPAQDSHLIAHAAAADAIALIPAGSGELAAGEVVEYLPL